jgi:hypothetical protein
MSSDYARTTHEGGRSRWQQAVAGCAPGTRWFRQRCRRLPQPTLTTSCSAVCRQPSTRRKVGEASRVSGRPASVARTRSAPGGRTQPAGRAFVECHLRRRAVEISVGDPDLIVENARGKRMTSRQEGIRPYPRSRVDALVVGGNGIRRLRGRPFRRVGSAARREAAESERPVRAFGPRHMRDGWCRLLSCYPLRHTLVR